MKTGLITTMIMIAVFAITGYKAGAQQYNEYGNVNNQYGPPTYTGGTVHSPSESFAIAVQNSQASTPETIIDNIFPNPAMSTSNITLAEVAVSTVTVYIINLNGTIVRTYTYNGGHRQFNLDVSGLQDGLYSIEVQEQGKSMQSIKLLKQS